MSLFFIRALCEIRRIAVLKSHDTDLYSSYRVPRHATYPPSVRNCIRTDSDLTCGMENPLSGYVIETRRVETRKFPYTFRFAANNGVPYTSARSVKLGLSFRVFLKIVFSTLRTVSLGILFPKY